MAKKTATRSKPTADADRVAFQVRFDHELHEQLKRQAEEADLSLNQLIQGICRTASRYLVQGEPVVGDNDFVGVHPMKRCVFFGRPGDWGMSEEERYEEQAATGEEPKPLDPGFVLFSLDFTERGVATVPQDQRQPRR